MTLGRLSLLLALSPLVACNGGGYGYNGEKTSDYFNAVGITRSTYAYDDQELIPDNLLIEKVEPTTTEAGREMVTLEMRMEDESETFVGGVIWSNAPGESTQIHGWAGADGVYNTYDPPISVTDDDGYMLVGDSVTTETGGTTFTSTYVGKEDCQVLWTPDPWEGCLHFTIDDGGGPPTANDPATRPLFVGDYHLVTRFFIAWVQPAGYDLNWILSDYDEPEDAQ